MPSHAGENHGKTLQSSDRKAMGKGKAKGKSFGKSIDFFFREIGVKSLGLHIPN